MPTFLFAVERIIGGIQIQHDASWLRAMSFQEQINKQPLDSRVVVKLVVAVPTDPRGMLQRPGCSGPSRGPDASAQSRRW